MDVPQQRFQLFQQLQYYLKVIVFLLPKVSSRLERDTRLSTIVSQILTDGSEKETIVTLEIRLTSSLVWHLLKENLHLPLEEKVRR